MRTGAADGERGRRARTPQLTVSIQIHNVRRLNVPLSLRSRTEASAWRARPIHRARTNAARAVEDALVVRARRGIVHGRIVRADQIEPAVTVDIGNIQVLDVERRHRSSAAHHDGSAVDAAR